LTLNLFFFIYLLGSFKPPTGGFEDFPIKLNKIDSDNQLPVAHTCFNTLDLPVYPSKEILR
jgi:hypothetical protein